MLGDTETGALKCRASSGHAALAEPTNLSGLRCQKFLITGRCYKYFCQYIFGDSVVKYVAHLSVTVSASCPEAQWHNVSLAFGKGDVKSL